MIWPFLHWPLTRHSPLAHEVQLPSSPQSSQPSVHCAGATGRRRRTARVAAWPAPQARRQRGTRGTLFRQQGHCPGRLRRPMQHWPAAPAQPCHPGHAMLFDSESHSCCSSPSPTTLPASPGHGFNLWSPLGPYRGAFVLGCVIKQRVVALGALGQVDVACSRQGGGGQAARLAPQRGTHRRCCLRHCQVPAQRPPAPCRSQASQRRPPLTLHAVGQLAWLARALAIRLSHQAQALLAAAIAVVRRAKAVLAPLGALQRGMGRRVVRARVARLAAGAARGVVGRWWGAGVDGRTTCQPAAPAARYAASAVPRHRSLPARRPWLRHHRSHPRSPLHHTCRCRRCI